MTKLDRSYSGLIENQISQQSTDTKVGKVVQVYEHTVETDGSNFEADVVFDGGTREERVAPIAMNGPESITVPRVGDTVVVDFLDDESNTGVITGHVSTAVSRPTVGKAGLRRRRIPGANSPLGNGDLYIDTFTDFVGGEPADINPDNLDADESLIRLAAYDSPEADPTDETTPSASIEIREAETDDEATISLKVNKADGTDTSQTWGVQLDVKTGEITVSDSSGFGIESDGDGNFTWHHKTIDFNEVSGSTGPLDLQ